MKTQLCTAALFLCASSSLEATDTQTCNVTASVIDQDPRGTNVRKTPGGDVIATLRAPQDDWIEVHVVRQAADWYLIDRADRVGDDSKTIFRGKGYMHRTVLGADGLVNGEPIRADHDVGSPQILRAEDSDQQGLSSRLLGRFHEGPRQGRHWLDQGFMPQPADDLFVTRP
ncbi:MAG: hypothetical protein ABIS51_06810 [Sphingomonas sp.]